MVRLKPFRALRPAPGLEERIAALPYDVYDRKEAREAALREPMSFLNIDRPETQFPEGYDMYAPEVYEKARELLMEEKDQGLYLQDDKECFYLYELTMDGRSQTGIVACAYVDDYLGGSIKKHENTRADKELDRIRHVDACGAQTGPIFLAYRNREDTAAVAGRIREQAPVFDFTSEDGIGHRGWIISGKEDIEAIRRAFMETDSVYIADGHHRAASAVRTALARRERAGGAQTEADWFLSVLFPDDELKIMDYNRVVKDLNGLNPEQFMQQIEEKCDITEEKEPVRPSRKGEMGMYLSGKWYRVSFHSCLQSDDPVEGLDVSILQREILQPILGIEDPRTDERIRFSGGIRGLKELERLVDGGWAAAFSMYPTSIGELFAVADAGLLMPPKSTWFEPKLRSGLFIHLFDPGQGDDAH
ncbi:MAG: DUF1015 family protein [Lachnospiraceae bacterium]|nr:DUF1015 family protein [Lachnospiraceae bacterium]